MKKIILLITIISLLGYTYGCSNHKKSSDDSDTSKDTITEANQNDTVSAQADSKSVHMDLVDGKGKLQLHKEKGQIVYVDFISKGYKKLSGQLSSKDSLANIRFTQIFLPDGTMDGPFGKDISYDLPADGTYKVSIAENMMAGDPWSGDFEISITLQ